MDDAEARGVVPQSGDFTSAESRIPPGEGRDAPVRLETRGIDYIPAVERNSRPANLAWTYFGAQFGYALYVLGGLLPVFGLGWWPSFWAIIAGTLVGSLAVAAIALIGPRTGTNSTVSSVASFGVRGRYLGSIIAQFDNLGFNVIIIWSGGLGLPGGSVRHVVVPQREHTVCHRPRTSLAGLVPGPPGAPRVRREPGGRRTGHVQRDPRPARDLFKLTRAANALIIIAVTFVVTYVAVVVYNAVTG